MMEYGRCRCGSVLCSASRSGLREVAKGKMTWAKLETEEKYARLRKYFADLNSRESFKETFQPSC